jgi:anti-sigma-K factor RskA
MAIMLLQQPSDSSALSGAVVQSNVDSPLWLISESPTERRLRLRPVAAESAQAGKDYELWIVPDAGAPLSLGVISVEGVYQVELSDRDREILGESRTLAISLEPRGGSPTGAPTGPILHVATLYDM